MDHPEVLAWRDGRIEALDQRLLPHQVRSVRIGTVDELVEAIAGLAIRGAPVLGAAGALGVALAVRQGQREGWDGTRLAAEAGRIAAARPTAVNLSREVAAVASRMGDGPAAVEAAALAVLESTAAVSLRISERGAAYLRQECGRGPLRVHTHCNTGALACLGWGSALGVIRALHAAGALGHVIVDETRPLLQGARLTCWELGQLGIEHWLAADGAAPFLISQHRADAVVVGADRIAANGDVANKIGTYSLALAARQAGIPFLVAAPESTIDPATPSGAAIPLEQRSDEEITVPAAPDGTRAINLAFDITPAELVSAVVTEDRLIRPGQWPALAAASALAGVRLPERGEEQLGGLRAGDAVLAVQHEERHPSDPQRAGLVDVGLDRVGVVRARHHGAYPLSRDIDLAEQRGQGVRVGQVGAFGEVRAEQPFRSGGGHAELGRQVQGAVRVQGVDGQRGPVVEGDALGRAEPGHPVHHGPGVRPEPPGHVVHGRHRLPGGHVRVQLEAAPGDGHIAGVLEFAQRPLEPVLADVAPGADHVGPDLDLHAEVNRGGPGLVPGGQHRCSVLVG
jgi:methylthioribose-1-phosphate isomerase